MTARDCWFLKGRMLVVILGGGGWGGRGGVNAYTWFSPLGEKTHAATDIPMIITKPMMTLHL